MKKSATLLPGIPNLVGQTVRIARKGTVQHKKVIAQVWEGKVRMYKVLVLGTEETLMVDATIWDRLFMKTVDTKPDFKARQSYVTGNQIANPFRNK